LDELEDEPTMTELGEGGEGVGQRREGITVGEGVGPGEVGDGDSVQEDLVDKRRVMVRLKRQVDNDIREQLLIKALAHGLGHTVNTGIVILRPRWGLVNGVVCIFVVVSGVLGG
jgi:hypothetical protein